MDFISSHRILLSRLFALTFFLILLFSVSAEEESIISDLLYFIGIILVGIATVGRLWCSLYISGYKDSQLITVGPYSLCRNPLYFFSFLGFIGIGCATEMFTFVFLFPILFAIIYIIIIKKEENFLQATFGEDFTAYCEKIPCFLPSFKNFTEPSVYVVNPKMFRKTMKDVLWFIWLIAIIELVEVLHEFHFLMTWFNIF